MIHAAQQRQSSVVPFRRNGGPGPGELPGIDSFYLLSRAGKLGRYQEDGVFVEDRELTETLGAQIESLLHQYCRGDAEAVAIGLVTPRMPERPWRTASLVFTDNAVRSIFQTSSDPTAPLTAFQRRNRTKSIYRGMELVLDSKKTSQPQLPRFCPVLLQPEVDGEVLARRYGLEDVDRSAVLEVLDLMAASPPEDQHHPALSRMVMEMTRDGIAPELRTSPELLMLAEERGESPAEDLETAEYALQHNPWESEPEDENTGFNDGDPVTYWLLSGFAPFNELNDLQRQFVARGHTIARKPAGATLIERESREDLTIYLVEGTLELEAYDGRIITIVGGTRRAHLPISQLRPHAYTVRAVTDVSVIMVSQDMVREIMRITTTYRSHPGIEVHEDDAVPEYGSGAVPYHPA